MKGREILKLVKFDMIRIHNGNGDISLGLFVDTEQRLVTSTRQDHDGKTRRVKEIVIDYIILDLERCEIIGFDDVHTASDYCFTLSLENLRSRFYERVERNAQTDAAFDWASVLAQGWLNVPE